MRKYFYILLTIVVVFFYKVFLIGILDNETFFIAIIINVVLFSLLILIIPLLLASRNKASFWLNVNNYTKYSLLIFFIIFIMPQVYTKYFMASPDLNNRKNYSELKSELRKLKVKFGNQYDTILDFEKYFDCAISKIRDLPPNEIDKIIPNLSNPNSKIFNEMLFPCVKKAIIKKTSTANTVIGLVESDTITGIATPHGTKVKLTIGNTEYYYIVDSGASELFISSKLLEEYRKENPELAITELPSQNFLMANGVIQMCKRYQIEKVQLGKFIIPNVNFATIEGDCNSLLGQNILKRFKSWTIIDQNEKLILNK
jgi:hypothetical protein